MIRTTGLVTQEEVRAIPVAERGDRSDRWKGVAHTDLLDAIFGGIEKRGMTVIGESWELQHEGHDLFGRLDMRIPDDLAFPDGLGLSLGFRHSNMGRYSLTFAVGANVFVCSNGMITGEFIVKRKHTKNVELIPTVEAGIDRFMESAKGISPFVNGLKDQVLFPDKACQYIIEAGRRGVMPWSHLNRVQALWHEPNHEEFKERNGWSLYNAFTEVIRDKPNVLTQMNELRAVGEFILDPLNYGTN